MSIWGSLFVADLINNFIITSFPLSKFIEKNNKSNKSKIILLLYTIALAIITVINTVCISNESRFIKSIIKIMLTAIVCYLVLGEKFSKALMSIFLIYIVFAIYDSIFGLIYLNVLNLSLESFNSNGTLILLVNILMAIVTCITIFSKRGKSFVNNIITWYGQKNNINLVVNILISMLVLWFFINRNTAANTPLYEYILNFGVIVIIIAFVIGFFKENSDKNYIKKEYDHLFDYAKTYEQEVVEKSKWQHEYENQLVIIKDKIDPENKKAIAYIDKLLKNKPSGDNSQWLIKLSKFPDIGIKGLLHYKICQMIQNNIHVYVDVIDEDLIPAKVPEKLLEENLQDISMALGVYLDNAMQAANESDNKYLIVEFKCTKEEIVFQISNTYKGSFQIDKLNQERFTTKGKSHGYGLSIVRDILSKNKRLKQEKEMNGMYYVQKLIFNLKK